MEVEEEVGKFSKMPETLGTFENLRWLEVNERHKALNIWKIKGNMNLRVLF